MEVKVRKPLKNVSLLLYIVDAYSYRSFDGWSVSLFIKHVCINCAYQIRANSEAISHDCSTSLLHETTLIARQDLVTSCYFQWFRRLWQLEMPQSLELKRLHFLSQEHILLIASTTHFCPSFVLTFHLSFKAPLASFVNFGNLQTEWTTNIFGRASFF